ncbi:MAG: hypothetical protein JNK17_17665 [Hydrogenophaga sp.]|nr:hypothetical protein [Hydrogenophaga sp.]
MLRVSIHHSALADRSTGNLCALLEVVYAKQSIMADYVVGLGLSGEGQREPAAVLNYPRWAGSLWDLVVRALGASLYGNRPIPPADKPDRRCAYSTKLCAVIEGSDAQRSGLLLGSASVMQDGKERGRYVVELQEDILGTHRGRLVFGTKRLNPAELLLRAACQALYGAEQPGARPALIVPSVLKVEGVDHFDIEGLREPARTGFKRYLARQYPTAQELVLGRAEDYAEFLAKG